MTKVERAAEEFRTLATSPGTSDWTEKDDKLLVIVARRYGIDEDELFGALLGGPPRTDGLPIGAIAPENYKALWRALFGDEGEI